MSWRLGTRRSVRALHGEEGLGIAISELYHGGAPEVDEIDSGKALAFNEGGVGSFTGNSPQPGADDLPAVDGGRLSPLVAEVREVADEERQMGRGEIVAEPGDQRGQLPGMGGSGAFTPGIGLTLMPKDPGKDAGLRSEAGTADRIFVERGSGAERVNGRTPPGARDQADYPAWHFLAQAQGKGQAETEGGALLVQVQRMCGRPPAGPAPGTRGFEGALSTKHENARGGIVVARLPRVLRSHTAVTGHVRLPHQEKNLQLFRRGG